MLLFTGLVFGGALFSQVQKNGGSADGAGSAGGGGEKRPVDIMASEMYSDRELLRSHGIEEGARILVGNVAFHHNGAVISCDSAISYSNSRIDCFHNVIINKDSTFVYGDRAEYNGDANLARVYSPVIKVVDGDALLYTYNFTFNTRDNVGRWFGGGVVYQQDNTMESEMGWFYSDTHDLVAVRNVQLKNDSHQIISDSVRYNTETKVVDFFTQTYIWTDEGEMISALKGRYNTQDSTYFFRDNAYLLDEFRETWADTIDYRAKEQDAVLYGNVQIDDNEHDSSAFGDLGHYWGERGETRLTRRPSILNYDADQGNSDTLYMRADTIFMYVVYPSDRRRSDSLADAGGETVDPHAHLKWVDSLGDSVRVVLADSLSGVISGLRERIAGLRRHADSIMNVLYPPAPPESESGVAQADSMPEIGDTQTDSLPETDTEFARTDSLEAMPAATDTLSPVDSLLSGALRGTEPLTIEPETIIEPEPEPVEPPEVVELRGEAAELTRRADSLQTAETYIRPRAAGIGAAAVDSLARLRLDSIARVDSLVRVDSIRIADPKAFRKLQKAETKRLKAEKARLAAKQREAKFAEKARVRAEKQRLKAEKRAAKTAAVAERRRSLGRKVGRGAVVDSLAAADSLSRDSLAMLDSLLHIDSLAGLDSLPPNDTTAAGRDTTMRIFRGWYNVKIWRKDMQAVADSMVGFSADSTLHMYDDPILWYSDSQITADSIILYTAGQQIDHAEFFGDPIMGSQIGGPDSRQFNQVKGNAMTSWFVDGQIRRHDTRGNAQALYYMQEEEKEADGSTVMSEAMAFLPLTSDNMSFIFEDDSLRYIVAREQPVYDVLPMDQIPGTQTTRLQGFAWRIERKPALSDVFDRTVRPSERDFHESLARPEFPIAARIDRRREYLIANRMWADRTDPLPAYAIDFRHERYRGE